MLGNTRSLSRERGGQGIKDGGARRLPGPDSAAEVGEGAGAGVVQHAAHGAGTNVVHYAVRGACLL